MAAAGVLVMAAAGCGGGAAAPKASAAPSWQGVADGCPALTAAPYGIDGQGRRTTLPATQDERERLEKVAPGAVFDDTICEYADTVTHGIRARVRLFQGNAAAAQADAFFQSERSAALSGEGVEVPGLGDAAFAYYFEPLLFVRARSRNAVVVVQVTPGEAAHRKFDLVQPLQQQVPALTPVMTDVLASLR